MKIEVAVPIEIRHGKRTAAAPCVETGIAALLGKVRLAIIEEDVGATAD